jgi:hypothetical protein
MFINVLTVFSCLFVTFYVFGVGVIYYNFSRLSPSERFRSSVNLSLTGTVMFLLSVSFLVAHFFL